MRDRVEGVRLALELASAVRDQYAHQAHTIILGNDSHLRFYDEAVRRVGGITAKVRAHVASPEERGWVDDIERASAQLDQVFRTQIVPSVLRHDRTGVQEEHARAQLIQPKLNQVVVSVVKKPPEAAGPGGRAELTEGGRAGVARRGGHRSGPAAECPTNTPLPGWCVPV